MNLTKMWNGLLIGVLAFCVARCEVAMISPLIIGFFLAICLSGENSIASFVGGVLGLLTTVPPIHVIRYGLVMITLAGILNIKVLLETRGKELSLSFLTGSLLTIISLTFKLIGLATMNNMMAVLEGVLVFATGIIYLYAIKTIKNDYGRITTENEAAISCLILGGTVLFGVPATIFDVIVLREAVAIFGMLVVIYKFGFGIGMCWSMITGFIMSYWAGVEEYFVAWILIGVLCQGLSCVFGGGRLGFGLYYVGVYLLVGTYLYPVILSENGIKALVSAAFVFLLAPKRFMLKLEEDIREDMLWSGSAEWGRLIIDRVNNLSRAFKRIEYTLAGEAGSGIGFSDVGNIIHDFTNQLERTVPMRKTISSAIISQLALRDIQVKNLSLIKNQDERYEVYITSKIKRGRLVLASAVRDIVSKEMGMAMELKDESRNIVSNNYELICLRQKPSFSCQVAVRRLSKYENEVSGDDFYVGDLQDGQKLIMLADGMGNGPQAAGDSSMLLESIEELLTAGFDKDTSIKIVNTYLAEKNKGERFSTLDMLILDMHTGYGRIYKQGAATTFVKRGQWIELIKSTSLPMGVIDGAICESCKKKFYNGDIIVMVSDGVLESIVFENKEDYLKDMLINLEEEAPEDIASAIVTEIRSVSGNRLRDDASVIVIKLNKNA
ncbi:MAG: hypothetical protein E7257_05030 [Lachnospiraceae bacterium]|nr:hypothetical protein [Lachnospiraceae bacterium]MBQ9936405.1 SpoIIE family protein phosphatase [Lachnospiraceae bacterium]